MNVKQLISTCSQRYIEVIIRDNLATPVAKGNLISILNNRFHSISKHITCEELLKSEVYCFCFLREKLYVTLK